MGRGNERLFTRSWSHDQDGSHAYMYMYMAKTCQKSSTLEPVADFPETWYVALGTPAHYSLFKC